MKLESKSLSFILSLYSVTPPREDYVRLITSYCHGTKRKKGKITDNRVKIHIQDETKQVKNSFC